MFSKRTKNVILSLSIIGILFSTFVIIDRSLGLVLNNESTQVNNQVRLILEPNSKAEYQTVEFDWLANINSLGLRDYELNKDKGDKYRILCFGDSWTFGWGVNIENSWPKKLEQYLIAAEYDNIEVINCGIPGGYTSTYKKYMEKTVPFLKPNLILVGVLSVDDLAQLYENKFITIKANKFKNLGRRSKTHIKRYLKYSFKILFQPSKPIDIKSIWEKTSKSMMENFNHLQKIRFYNLNDSVQSMFISGDLNPAEVNYYINFADKVNIFNNPNNSATMFSIQEMDKDFRDMRKICNDNNAKLIFINLPSTYFTGHLVIRTPSDIFNPYFEKNNNIDTIYRAIAENNNLPYITMTDHFIDLQNKSDYFFKYDGHPNEKGYDEISKFIYNKLIENNASLLRING